MKNWREYLNLANKIAIFGLFILGSFHGIFMHEYALGSWELILAMYCRGDYEIKS